MDKILDILTEIEAEVEWSVYDGKDNEKIIGLIHQAMDIAVRGKAHKWPDEKPKPRTAVLIRKAHNGALEVAWHDGEWWWTPGFTVPYEGEVNWWELQGVVE